MLNMSKKGLKDKFNAQIFVERLEFAMPNDFNNSEKFVKMMQAKGYKLEDSAYIDNGFMTKIVFIREHSIDRVSTELEEQGLI